MVCPFAGTPNTQAQMLSWYLGLSEWAATHQPSTWDWAGNGSCSHHFCSKFCCIQLWREGVRITDAWGGGCPSAGLRPGFLICSGTRAMVALR